MSKEVLAAANKVLPQWGLTSKLQRLCYYKISVLNSSDGFQNPALRLYLTVVRQPKKLNPH